MKIVIAPDKFKGSLTALEFCDAVEEGIKEVIPKAQFVKLPLADGGDGTIEVVKYYLNGTEIRCEVNDPFFRKITASYLYSKNTQTAFIEMAEASGLKLLKKAELDCKNTTTLGTGQLIKDAINQGAKTVILGIGGSATNDCGIGMATAFGYRFLDKNSKEVKPIGKNLSRIELIDDSNVDLRVQEVSFKIACDVTNPLYGKNGAAHIYAAQKGANQNDIELLDHGLKDFSKVLELKYSINPQKVQGAGAAGGMGIASKLFLNGELESGIDLIMELANFNKHIKNADYIITGEGKLDKQTLSGKTISGVIKKAQKSKSTVAAFCGVNELTDRVLQDFGINETYTVLARAMNVEDAIGNSYNYVKVMAKDFAREKLL